MIFENIEELCKERNITIAGLERKLDFGNGTIRAWNRVSPSADKLKAVSEFFGCSMESLMTKSIGVGK